MAPSLDAPFKFLSLGAIIQEFNVSGLNIVQGFPTAEDYKKYNAPFFGEVIGRVANRVSGARINNLNGKSYQLAANNGPNSLHGGPMGWGKREFEGPILVNRDGKESVLFKYKSPDGEEGYPGTVELRVWYKPSIDESGPTPVIVLETEYEAELVDDSVEETAVAVTNHSYFNLSGLPTIAGTVATLSTKKYMVVDDGDIPTGPIEDFPGIQAGQPFVLGEVEPDIDHCFIMNMDPKSVPLDTRGEPLQTLAKFYHQGSKVHLEVQSTEPAFQFYTGKYIDVPAVEGVPARGARAGFCVEPSRYVNAVNVDEWKGMVLLKRGQVWGSRMVYRGYVE
ncbi:galactose mutarotase-like domain-containing protein [Lineolata rhizophorae]|uniref:Galactose mutarotase-like domain-containing protein n=1 Tax=Lineolata rhizophorae TaxID=578093 RepID=A0A6A6P6V5_9PEZI|nr:galactose mutarotase-like domain-containing protein [Lineolata rhizophorae]